VVPAREVAAGRDRRPLSPHRSCARPCTCSGMRLRLNCGTVFHLWRAQPYGSCLPLVLFRHPRIPNNPPGFSPRTPTNAFGKQYSQMLKAFRKANYQGVQAAFATFKLPPQWFGQTFGPESGGKLAAYYEREFENFVTATEKLYGSTYDAGINSIDTQARKFNPAGVL
jgi:hypothetical protein